jgi:hypothetical protein
LDYITAVKNSLELTEEMLESAQNDQWDVVADKGKAREDLLQDLVSKDVERDQAEEARSIIEDILDLNQKIALLGQETLTKYQIEMKQINQGKKMANAYMRNPDSK